MALSYFTIPDTGTIVYEGDLVILSEYPDNFAIASHGWYEYEQTRANGWYFVLLPRRETIPAANVNVSLLTVVTSTSCAPPCPTPIPDPDEHTQSRTFITFDTIAQRDGLTPEFIPDGRIVRINDAGEGKAEYYQWSAENEVWITWDIQSNMSSQQTQIDEAGEQIESLAEQVAAAETQIASAEQQIDEVGQQLQEYAETTEQQLTEIQSEVDNKIDNADDVITTNMIVDESVSLSKLSESLQSTITSQSSSISSLESKTSHLDIANICKYVIALDSNGSIIKILSIVSAGDLAVLSPSKVYIPADWTNVLQSGAFAGLAPDVLYVVDDSINGQTFDPADYAAVGIPTVSYDYDINNVILAGLKDMSSQINTLQATIGTLNDQLETALNGGGS